MVLKKCHFMIIIIIWKKVCSIIKVKFDVNPIYDERYIGTKLKMYDGHNNTIFIDSHNKITTIPQESINYMCIPIIDIDSVLNI